MIKFSSEIARKFIHLSSLWIPLLYVYSNKEFLLYILFPLSIFALSIDFARRFFPSINSLVNLFFGHMMRDKEKNSFAFSGASYLLLASTLTIFFFKKEVAIFALTILMISDSCAALVGRRFGTIKLLDKTLEGSLSFILSGIFVYLFYKEFYQFSLPLYVSLLSIFIASIAELFVNKINFDDNFVIPFAIGIVFWIL